MVVRGIWKAGGSAQALLGNSPEYPSLELRAIPILATATPCIVITDLTFGNSVELIYSTAPRCQILQKYKLG